MNDSRLELLNDLNRKIREREDIKLEKHRMNMRRKEIYRRAEQNGILNTPAIRSMLLRYKLEIKDLTDQINELNEQIFIMESFG